MIDFRRLVRDELDRIGKTCYWLGRQDGVSCHEDTIRLWLMHGKNIGAASLAEILDVLGFRVQRPRRAPSTEAVAAVHS